MEKDKKTLEVMKRYMWHDLRKNPNDLPTAHCEVFVVAEGDHWYTAGEQAYLMAYFIPGEGFKCCNPWSKDVDVEDQIIRGLEDYVIAWKSLMGFREETTI